MSYPNINEPPSPVVGDCNDCIISLPDQPLSSMHYSMTISQGYNLVLKNAGTVNGTYASNNLGAESVTLPPDGRFTLAQSLTSLAIGVDHPVMVSLGSNGTMITFSINKMFFIDQEFDSLTIINPAPNTIPTSPSVKVVLFFTLK